MTEGSLVAEDDFNSVLKSQCVLKERVSYADLQTSHDNIGTTQASKFFFFTVEYHENGGDKLAKSNRCSTTRSDHFDFTADISSLSDVVLQNDLAAFQNPLVLLPATRVNSHSDNTADIESLVLDQLLSENKTISLNQGENQNFETSQLIIHPPPTNISTQYNFALKSPALTQKLILMPCTDENLKETFCKSDTEHPNSNNNAAPHCAIGVDKKTINYNITGNNQDNDSEKSNKTVSQANRHIVNGAVQTHQYHLLPSSDSNTLDEIVAFSQNYVEHSKCLLEQIHFSIKTDHKNDANGVEVDDGGSNDEGYHDNDEESQNISDDNIVNNPSPHHDTFLSTSDEGGGVLTKAEEDLLNVEFRSELSTADDGPCYPAADIDKVDNEFLMADANEFEATDTTLLPSSLTLFATQVPSHNEFIPPEKMGILGTQAQESVALAWLCKCELGMKSGLKETEIVPDKPVMSRARATLPKDMLTIDVPIGSTFEEGVFARKTIMKRMRFGPVEGRLLQTWAKDEESNRRELQLLLEVETGRLVKLDLSNEHDSNWMRFVRQAKTLKEQNMILTQQGKSLYYVTTRVIPPRQELKVGYSPQYARRRKLTPLDDTSRPYFALPSTLFNRRHSLKTLHLDENDKKPSAPKALRSNRAFVKRTPSVSQRKYPTPVLNPGDRIGNECWTCGKVFPRSYSLKRHLLAVHSEKDKENTSFIRPVDTAQKTAVTNTLFKKHSSTGTKSEWLCTHCNLTFDNSSVLNLHTLTHAAEDLESSAVLGLPSELSSVYHEGEFLIENGQVQCPQCTKEFSTKKELVDHVSAHGKVTLKRLCVNPPSSYKCDRCYKSFATDVRLKRHMHVHGAEDTKPFQCNTCLKRFLNNSALSCHLKTHNEKKFFDCPICKEEFQQVFGLKEHVKVHSTDGVFTCPHCSKVFHGYSIIRKHIRAFHSGHQHKCEECGKLCVTLDKLRMHSLKHSDHREFLCANCGKQFKRKDKLKDHMKRIHSTEREAKSTFLRVSNPKERSFTPKEMSPATYDRFIYKCRICMVGFKRRGMLVNHLARRHPDVVPDTVPELNLPILKVTTDYFCQYCDKIYRSSSKRKAHILKNHPGAQLPMTKKGEKGHLIAVPNPTYSQTVGSIKTTPHACKWCHKQYASKAKLLQHHRKNHVSLLPQAQQVPQENISSSDFMTNPTPPLPENKRPHEKPPFQEDAGWRTLSPCHPR